MNTSALSQLDWALSQWRLWQCPGDKPPEIESHLPGGLSNSSWLVNTGNGRAVVRVNSPWDKYFNVNRCREAVIQRTMARQGIAPAIWFVDVCRGVLVSEFIDGEPLGENAPQSERHRLEVQALIATMQNIFIPLPRFDYLQHLAHYEAGLLSIGVVIPENLLTAASRLRQEYPGFPGKNWPSVIVHHDLLPANLIDTGRGLKILDWEYAAMGCGALDRELWFPPSQPPDQPWSLYGALINGYWHLLNQGLMTPSEK